MNDVKSKKAAAIDWEFIIKVIESRGYFRHPDVPSMNSLIYEKVKKYYEPAGKSKSDTKNS